MVTSVAAVSAAVAVGATKSSRNSFLVKEQALGRALGGLQRSALDVSVVEEAFARVQRSEEAAARRWVRAALGLRMQGSPAANWQCYLASRWQRWIYPKPGAT